MIKQQQVFVEENISNLTSSNIINGGGGDQSSSSIYYYSQQQQQQQQSQDQDHPQQPPAKKKRSLPGNPDPDAEVIAMSPKSLLATNRFVCEICNKGFQRDQNLQLHRRGHNLPWKLKQRTNKEVRKKVYVCPEESCVHHHPSRALGDLTGIKKHFCRKHGEKKWKCDKCSKRYAVQSDWKAHSKVCGTREYRCDCGTLFSRRDSFITHRAFCDALAEETAARSAIITSCTTTLPLPVVHAPSLPSHFINLQQQQEEDNNNPLHAFPLIKREQHQHQHHLPPWLSCPPPPPLPPPINHDHHHQSSSIFHHHQDHHQLGGPYHTQLVSTTTTSSPSSPHMSATALLQKAAQMGATQSHEQQGHVSDTTASTTASMFGFNLSSRDLIPNFVTNKDVLSSVSPLDPTGPSSSSSSSFFHDMMMNSLTSSSTYDDIHDDAFGIGFNGSNRNGNRKQNESAGLTRDFLGLRPLSHNDILTIAGLGNCMTTTTTTNTSSHHHDHHQRSDGYP